MQRPQPRAQIKYKKPSVINPVSIMVFALMGAIGYAGYCYWPIVRLKSNAKSEMQEFLVQFYRLNLRHDKRRARDLEALETSFRTALTRVGVTDPNAEVKVELTPQIVSLDVSYSSQFELVGLDKRYPTRHSIHVETDAKRVDW
ncbi:MAG: hypothetical protein SF187_02665 [Deltaproteobacteria bacterium]|nr:hypothetical protein [Deltaproteobacteria bacterium]